MSDPMSACELDAVIGRLTPMQRAAIKGAHVLYPGCWLFRLGTARGMIPLGLGTRTIDGVALTARALAIRARLGERHD